MSLPLRFRTRSPDTIKEENQSVFVKCRGEHGSAGGDACPPSCLLTHERAPPLSVQPLLHVFTVKSHTSPNTLTCAFRVLCSASIFFYSKIKRSICLLPSVKIRLPLNTDLVLGSLAQLHVDFGDLCVELWGFLHSHHIIWD